MGAREMVRSWHSAVKGFLGGVLHGHQLKALSLFSWAMVMAGHCHSGRLAAVVPGAAQVASRRRRFERLLSNAGLSVALAMDALARSVLSAWAGRPLVLILDETCRPLPAPPGAEAPPQGHKLCCMKLSVAYRKRAIPLAFACYEMGGKGPGKSVPKLVLRLLRRVARLVPPECPVTLLADRGLCWPKIVDFCRCQGWHFVLRLQGQTAVRWTDEQGRKQSRHAKDLAPRRGCRPWSGSNVELFRSAGWRRANVVAVWEERCREPWLLVTDLSAQACARVCHTYGMRAWCEQMHRDEKGCGFRWDASHVSDPEHAERLLLVMALAMLLAAVTGSVVLKRGRRCGLEGRGHCRRRLLSIVQLGLRCLRDCLVNERPLPISGLHLYPP